VTEALSISFAPLQCTSNSAPPAPQPHECGLVSLTGWFRFDDVNGDGHIVRSELLQLSVGDWIATAQGFPQGGPVQVFSFDYAPPTGLSFRATDGWRYSVTTGVSYRYDSPSGSLVYAWIPTTETSIFAVPEPGSFGLLPAGGAALAGRARRRFLRQPPAAKPGSSAGPTQPSPRALT
jgi:hypothetical protein